MLDKGFYEYISSNRNDIISAMNCGIGVDRRYNCVMRDDGTFVFYYVILVDSINNINPSITLGEVSSKGIVIDNDGLLLQVVRDYRLTQLGI